MRSTHLLRAGLGAVVACAVAQVASSQQQLVHISIDWKGPTVGLPDTASGTPITEGDILLPGPSAPGFAPLPVPVIAYSAGNVPVPGLGLTWHPPCVGHPGGTPCAVEVDALSFGWDLPLSPNQPSPHAILFSADEFALGIAGLAFPPTVWNEAPAADLAADVLISAGLGAIPQPPFAAPTAGSVALLDGDGAPSPSGFLYPGFGLFEPRFPAPPPNLGDRVDALEVDPGILPALYFSLDSGWPDPLTGILHSGSAVAHNFVGGDVLWVPTPGAGLPAIYAPAPWLGLDLVGGPDSDDVDAIILWENGTPGYQPSKAVGDWIGGATDMLLFSVRRGSAVVGAPDSLLGIPIEPGDILSTPIPGGPSPFPSILIAAENLGLATLRSGIAPVGDDLDAADSVGQPVFDCDKNGVEDALDIALGTHTDLDGNGIPDVCQAILSFCTCPPPLGPCGNNDPNAGCANSTGAGALLSPSGSTSVFLDDLVMTASSLPGGVFGIMVSGSAAVGPISFGDGLRCTGGMLARWPVKKSSGAGVIAYGPGLSAYSVASLPPVTWLLPGTTWHFQVWFRDPSGPCGKAYNMTDALRVTFTP